MSQSSRASLHPGHDPRDQRVVVVEEIAMVLCSACSDEALRWRNPECDSEWVHHDSISPYEGQECEASAVLTAAAKLGIPLYTGADLDFPEHPSIEPNIVVRS